MILNSFIQTQICQYILLLTEIFFSTIIEVQTLLKMEMEIWKKLRLKAGKKKPEHRIRTLKLELGSTKH